MLPPPRLSLTACLLAVVLVAIDLAALRHATAPWASGEPLDQRLLNLLPMANALVLVGFGLARRRGEPRPFSAGFLAGGLAALALHILYDRASPRTMWAVCDRLANHSGSVLDALRLGPYATLSFPGKGTVFRFYPAFALVVAAPQFLAACLVGLLARRARARRAGTAPASPTVTSRAVGGTHGPVRPPGPLR